MTTKPVNINIDEGLWANSKAAAAKAGTTLTDWVHAALAASLDRKPEAPEPETSGARADALAEQGLDPPKTASAMTAEAKSIATAQPEPGLPPSPEELMRTCTHPKDQWQRVSWGTVCGICKTRMR